MNIKIERILQKPCNNKNCFLFYKKLDYYDSERESTMIKLKFYRSNIEFSLKKKKIEIKRSLLLIYQN